jgi:hypothetical protein
MTFMPSVVWSADVVVVRHAGAESCPATHAAGGANANSPELHFALTYDRTKTGFRVRLTSSGTYDGERTLETTKACRDLTPAIAIVLDLLNDEAARKTAAEPPRLVPMRPDRTAPIPDRLEPFVQTAFVEPFHPQGGVSVRTGVLLGVMSNATWTLSAETELHFRKSWSWFGNYTWAPPASEPVATGDVTFSAGVLETGFCLNRSRARVRASLCGGLFVGYRSGEARGLAVNRAAQLPWLGPSGRARFGVQLVGPFALEAQVRALVPVRRDIFVLDSSRERIDAPWAVGIEGAIGLKWGLE